MYVKFGRSKIFALFLALLAAFFITGTAMAATELKIGVISGDSVLSKMDTSGNGTIWDVGLAFYNTKPTPITSFQILSVSGSGYGPNGSPVTLSLDDANWRIDNLQTKDVALNPTGESFTGQNFTLSGPVVPGNILTLTGKDSFNTPAFVVFNITPTMKDLSLVVSPATLKPTVGTSFTSNNVVSVKGLQAGDTVITSFSLTKLEVRDSTGAAVTSWNGLTITPDPNGKTVTVTGFASKGASETFSLYAESPDGTIEVLTNAFTIDTSGSTGAALVLSPDVARFYIGVPRTRTIEITAPSDVFTTLTVSPTTWGNFTITTDKANKKITVSGTATAVDATSVDVYATNASGDVMAGTFSIVAAEPTSPNKLNTSKIGIWDYGNVSMMASELIYYNTVGTNTRYNVGGKYDLLFYSSAVMDGSKIRVYVKEPNDNTFAKLTRLPTSSIPKEAWINVNQQPQPSPYTVSPHGGGGSSFGWYRCDINDSANTMTIAVNSQPFMTGDYVFRFEYVYTDEYDDELTNYQEITVRCTEPIGGSSGGGGCDAGVGLMALLGLLSVGGFVAVNKRSRG